MELVSVIMAAYNGAATIKAAINSVQQQTYPQWELLVCDDGSTDETERIVAGLKDPRVRWLPGVPSGRPSVPRNRGIRAAGGEWLAFLDCDDEWLPDKLAVQMEQVRQKPYRAWCANARRLFPGQGIVGNMMGIPREKLEFADLLNMNPIVTSSILFHRSLLDSAAGFPEDMSLKVGEDYALWLRIACFTPIGVVFEPQLIYRDDAGHSTRSLVVRNAWQERQAVFADFLQWSVGNPPEKILPAFLAAARRVYWQAQRELDDIAQD